MKILKGYAPLNKATGDQGFENSEQAMLTCYELFTLFQNFPGGPENNHERSQYSLFPDDKTKNYDLPTPGS
jgi:hypothetical protein